MKEFEMSMIDEMNYFLGLHILQNSEGIFLSQTKYLKNMLKRFSSESCKPIGKSMVTSHNLSNKDETPTIEQKKYISIIGGLQYLTHTRPDTTNTFGIVARFQVDPKEAHYAAVKNIFRYLKGTLDFGLWYDRSNNFTLCAYTDVDWEGIMDDRKSSSGGGFFLGRILVSWLKKKHDCISQRTTEEKYVATKNNCKKIMWMKHMLKDIRVEFTKACYHTQ